MYDAGITGSGSSGLGVGGREPVALPPENQGAIRHATAIPTTTTAAVR